MPPSVSEQEEGKNASHQHEETRGSPPQPNIKANKKEEQVDSAVEPVLLQPQQARPDIPLPRRR